MIQAYCTDEITIWKSNGYDSWNEPLSGTAITVKGHVDWKTRLVRNIKGEQVVSTVMIYLPRKIERAAYLGRALAHEDRVQIGGENFIRAIITIQTPKAFSPNTSLFGSLYEVFLA